MHYHIRLVHRLCTFLAISALAAGCAFNVNPKVDISAFNGTSESSSNRISKKVALVLSKEFVDYTYHYRRGLDPYIFHIGPSLDAYAKRMAESHFQSVYVVSEASAVADVDVILTPTVRKMDLTSFLWGGEKQHMTIDVEWVLTAKPRSTTLWVNTSSGNSEGKQGTPFSGFKPGKKMIQNMIADLWKQTNQSFVKLHQIDTLK